MRNVKGLIAVAVAVTTAGCVESMDQGYGSSNGYYSNGYYPSSSYANSPGYYATPSVNNYYYNPSPTVVTQTRYVPVPTPVRSIVYCANPAGANPRRARAITVLPFIFLKTPKL